MKVLNPKVARFFSQFKMHDSHDGFHTKQQHFTLSSAGTITFSQF